MLYIVRVPHCFFNTIVIIIVQHDVLLYCIFMENRIFYIIIIVITFIIFFSVLRIRDVYPGHRIRIFYIPDPGSEFFPSWGSASKTWSIQPKILFLSSRKYDPDRSSRIRIQDPDFLPNLDPGVTKAPDPTWIRIRNTVFFLLGIILYLFCSLTSMPMSMERLFSAEILPLSSPSISWFRSSRLSWPRKPPPPPHKKISILQSEIINYKGTFRHCH